MIICHIKHNNNLFPPITLVNIYAPAQPQLRRQFYAELLQLPYLRSLFDRHTDQEGVSLSDVHHTIITGDFNYHLPSFPPLEGDFAQNPIHPSTDPSCMSLKQIQTAWHSLLLTSFTECSLTRSDCPAAPTFRRGTTCSTIDYIFASESLLAHIHASAVDFLQPTWTDHALLTTSFKFVQNHQGPGLWRANPHLAKNAFFINELSTALEKFHDSMADSALSVQDQWDLLKTTVRSVAHTTARRKAEWRQRQLKRLQRKRNKMFREYSSSTLQQRLPIVETQIGALQLDAAVNDTLRAGRHWQEHGETSAGFLKRTIEQKAVKRLIPELRHPETNEICSTPPHLHDAVCSFYQSLYTPDDIDHANGELLANSIPTTDRLPDTCHSLITRPFHITEIRRGASRSPRKSSPGPDGLPYEILCVVLENERSAALATKVYSDALQNALYPSSWQETCMSLLPKKGDLTSLKNWRPISLINTDAKVFTRLLNARLMPYLSKIITTNQLGFMPGRFIADHGQLLQLIQMSAEKTDSTTIGLLLDQEKAYDRIHPSYLSRIMLAFNIPQLIVDTVISLFFYTRIQVNINGHLTDTRITQSRGLRQGDPLSPLLFNIAFDPFLRMVSQDHHLKGFNFTTELPSSHLPASFEYTLQRFDQLHLSDDAPNIDPSVGPSHDPPSVSPPSVKILAYADDALIFLKDTLDFLRLQQAVNIYSTASNALLNYNKTQAFSLSGDPHPQWQAFLAEHNITLWHDRNSPSHLTYLGFAICSGTSQRSHFANLLTQKIQHACFVHSQRQLSVRGKATVLNTLIYSRLWHVIRLFPFTKAQLQKIRSIGNSFINQGIFPKLSHDLICLDRSSGGLGVLDPSLQQQALQWRWLRPLLLFSDKIHQSSPCLPYLRYVLNWFYSSDTYPTYHWALLFPACRLSSWSPKAPQGNIANISQLSNLFTAVDAIPHIFDSCHLNADTCLRLPLLELVHHTRPQQLLGQDNFLPPSHFFKRNPSAKKLIGHDLFIFEPNTQTIRYRLPTETIRFRNTTITVLTLLKTKQLLLQNFLIVHLFVAPRIAQSTDSSPLIDLSSCITSLISTSDNPIVHTRFQRCSPASPQYYKSLIPQKLPPDLVVLPPNKWKFFWRLQIPFKARTVWYRLTHKKLPTKQILNRYILPLHPTPNCQICPAESPTLECIAHFAYLCPIKSAVWNQIITAFFPARLLRQQYPAILYRLQRLKIPSTAPLPSSPNPKLSLYQVFACTLQSIWQAHWRFVFDDVQPVSANITKATLTAIQRLDSILNYDLS